MIVEPISIHQHFHPLMTPLWQLSSVPSFPSLPLFPSCSPQGSSCSPHNSYSPASSWLGFHRPASAHPASCLSWWSAGTWASWSPPPPGWPHCAPAASQWHPVWCPLQSASWPAGKMPLQSPGSTGLNRHHNVNIMVTHVTRFTYNNVHITPMSNYSSLRTKILTLGWLLPIET